MIPTLFEEYLAKREPGRPHLHDDGKCTGCLEREPVTSDGYCRECIRYQHGYDQAEEKVLGATVGGAVTSALELGVSSEAILLAVHRAVERHHDRGEDALLERLRETVERVGSA